MLPLELSPNVGPVQRPPAASLRPDMSLIIAVGHREESFAYQYQIPPKHLVGGRITGTNDFADLRAEKNNKLNLLWPKMARWCPVFDPKNPPENVYVGLLLAFFPRK